MLKVICIVMAVIMAVAIVTTIVGVAVNFVQYLVKQGIDFGTAFQWAWDNYCDWLRSLNPFKGAEADGVLEFPMANASIEVVGCISLK